MSQALQQLIAPHAWRLPFERAWASLGRALPRAEFNVRDLDRSAGVYFVRYVDPKQAGKDEPNFFSKLFGGEKDGARPQRLRVLVKAAGEGGYTGKFFTYYTGLTGTPTALGTGGEGRVYQVAYQHYNMGGQMGKWADEFKAKYKDDMYTGAIPTAFNVVGAAMFR